MKRLLTMVAAVFVATTTAVSAATYQVDGLLSDMGASQIHDMVYWDTVVWFDEEVETGGEWDSETGDLSFAGTLANGYFTYSASGNIDTNGGGFLNFVFNGGYGDFGFTFEFDGDLAMGVYNSVANGVISLWGDSTECDYSHSVCYGCYGMDLRIAVSETPSEVPLPASSLLLLGGMGAFAGLRRKKKS